MTDLTEAERAAIAAYPERKVQRIPTGKSGIYDEFGDPIASRSFYFGRYSPAQRKAVQDRRARVRELFEAGKSQKETAEILNVSPSIIQNDRRVLGLFHMGAK